MGVESVSVLIPVKLIMFRKSPSNHGRQDDQVPIIANESIEDDILSSEQHVADGKCCFVTPSHAPRCKLGISAK